MRVDKIYPSKWLKAVDLDGRQVKASIHKLTFEELDAGGGKGPEEKPVLWFNGAEKGLVLNVTNARTIAGAYGEETDDWTGRQITLYAAMVEAFGETHEVVRVKVTEENKRANRKEPEPEPPKVEAENIGDDDSSLPF